MEYLTEKELKELKEIKGSVNMEGFAHDYLNERVAMARQKKLNMKDFFSRFNSTELLYLFIEDKGMDSLLKLIKSGKAMMKIEKFTTLLFIKEWAEEWSNWSHTITLGECEITEITLIVKDIFK